MFAAENAVPDLAKVLSGQLNAIGRQILSDGPPAIRFSETRAGAESMVVVAHHADVVRVLTEETTFSVCHYDPLYAAIAPPGAFVLMRPEDAKRKERYAILNAAAAKTPWFGKDATARRALARACVDNVITSLERRRRFDLFGVISAPPRRRRFDLIGDFGYFVPYLVGKRLIGLPGPRRFGVVPQLVCAVNDLPVGREFTPETGPYLTGLVWSEFVLGQLFLNFENRQPVFRWVARWGAGRLRAHIERCVDEAKRLRAQIDSYADGSNKLRANLRGHIEKSRDTEADDTLLGALWLVRNDFPNVSDDDYDQHVVSLMIELMGTVQLIPGQGFSRILGRWVKRGGPGLRSSLDLLESIDVDDFVDEQLRLAPPADHLLRNATRPTVLGGLHVAAGEYVCALVDAAGRDIPDEPGKVRAGRGQDCYLHFGPEGGPHRCFGHLVAHAILGEMFLGLHRLPKLGPNGELHELGGLAPGRLAVSFDEPDRGAS